MKKLPALFSLATSIGLWYAYTQHPKNKNATDKCTVKISNHGVILLTKIRVKVIQHCFLYTGGDMQTMPNSIFYR